MQAQELVEKILSQHSLSEIISEFINLEAKGKSFLGLCPFHEDSRPSLSVINDKELFNCFACNTKGGLVQFIMYFKKLNRQEALQFLATKFKLDYQVAKSLNNFSENDHLLLEANLVALGYFKNRLIENLNNPLVKRFLEKRNLTSQALKRFQIGFDDGFLWQYLKKIGAPLEPYLITGLIQKKERYFDSMDKRLVFPIIDENEYVRGFSARALEKQNAKYWNSQESSVFKKQSLFYNLNLGLKKAANGNFQGATNLAKSLILVEGQMDVIALDKLGFSNTLALMGTNLSKQHLPYLKDQHLILFFDQDQAGLSALLKNAHFLISYGFSVSIVEILAKAKIETQRQDFDSVFQKQALQKLLVNVDPDQLVAKASAPYLKAKIINSKSAIDYAYVYFRKLYPFTNSHNIQSFSQEFSNFLKYQKPLIIKFYQNLLERHYGLELQIKAQRPLTFFEPKLMPEAFSSQFEEMAQTLETEPTFKSQDPEAQKVLTLAQHKEDIFAYRIFISLLEQKKLWQSYSFDHNLETYWKNLRPLLRNINLKMIHFGQKQFHQAQASYTWEAFEVLLSEQEKAWFKKMQELAKLAHGEKSFSQAQKFADLENFIFSLYKISNNAKIKNYANDFRNHKIQERDKLLVFYNLASLKKDEAAMLQAKLSRKKKFVGNDDKK